MLMEETVGVRYLQVLLRGDRANHWATDATQTGIFLLVLGCLKDDLLNYNLLILRIIEE